MEQSIRREAGKKAQKTKRKMQKQTEREGGGMVGWPAEITVRVTGQVTAAIDPLIGCLTVSTRLPNPLIRGVSYCVCVFV